MADNVAVTAGTGTSIAADDVGGVMFQRVKVCFGADGTGTDANSTTPLPVGGSSAASLGKAEDAAHTTGDVGVGALAVVTTSGTPTSATDGDYAFLSQNAVGGLRVTPVPSTVDGYATVRTTDTDETEDTIKASAGNLFSLELENHHASTAFYVHLYDAAAPDTSADTPKMTFRVNGASQRYIEFGPAGVSFATAITVGALTTYAPGAVGPGANEVTVTAVYK